MNSVLHGLSWSRPNVYGVAPGTEPAIALQVERETLKQPLHVLQPIAAPFEHIQLVVQSLYKAASLTADEVVRNQFPPLVQQREEWLEAPQAALYNPPLPST